MKNESFKTNMFRFVDVLPALKSGQDVAKHLKEYFAEKNDELPGIFNVGLGLGSLAPGIMATAIRKNVEQMAKMFITGETPADAVAALNKARKNKICFTVDILGEATLSESEAEQYQQKYLNLIGQLATESSRWDAIPQIDQDHYGPIPKVNVSVKLSALSSMINSTAWEETKNVLKVRLRPILRKAMETNTALSLDMEHYGVKNLTLEVFREILLEEEFKSYPHFGCVIQAYLRDSQLDLQELVAFSKKRGTPVNIRLVKGAYWDSETIEAKQKSWPTPVFLVKAESDANFEACAEFLLDHIQYVRPQFASHNVRTIAAAIVYAEQAGIPKNAFEIQMLFGMGDPIKKALVQMGFRVREYAPVGDLLPGMAYLVRRLLENTSNESWLRGKFAEGKSTSDLLKDPRQGLIPTTGDFQVPAGEFVNEAFVDFSIESNRRKMLQAIAQWESQLPLKIPIRIRNQMMDGKVTSPRPNPSQTLQCVSLSQLATTTQAQSAIDAAKAYFPVWKSKSPDERANILEKAADLMTAKKFQLASLQVLEVGKPWGEADADVAEAIDFCRYYAQQVRRMSKPQLAGKVPGELSLYQYRPRGVTAVIAPWNFPFAIICGMTAAALATGNTVVMKPAEQSPASAWELAKILVEAGVPTDALQFLPGVGEEIGDYLVRSPDIHTIAFTGSRSVGLQILRSANEVSHSQ
ncbi:MAG TPA: proline dehydrogenase family protein, partial [Pseudobdellovibrionaceae bacterium]|nr:proline dehydrogenase family protein [Pseudobdellovibrionaceae bacterium]